MKYLMLGIVSCFLMACSQEITKQETQTPEKKLTYPDTIRQELGGGLHMHIRHNPHLREFKAFDDKGHLFEQSYYIDDLEDSISTLWHDNGNKLGEIHYKQGKKHGRALFWLDNGILERDEMYENGELIKGTELHMDEHFLIDHIDIIADGKVVAKDSSLRGKPAVDYMNWSDRK